MAIGVSGLVGLATTGPAWAHSRLQHTSPADGSTVTAPIGEVVLTFNERVHGNFTTVVVTGPSGVSYSREHVQVIDDDVHQPVYPLHSGAYAVAWRAISADGHPVEGQFHFTVALPAGQEPAVNPPASPSRAAAATASAGGGGWLWAGVAVAVVAIAGVIGLLSRRRRAVTR